MTINTINTSHRPIFFKKIDYSYSQNGIYKGKLFYNDTKIGSFDTSASRNLSLVWDDDIGQYLIQTINKDFENKTAVEVKNDLAKNLKKYREV